MLYRGGPWLGGIAHAVHRSATDTGRDQATTAAVRRDFGTFSLAAAFQSGRWEGSRTAAAPANATSIFSRAWRSWMLGGTVSTWQGGRLHASFKRYDDRTTANLDATQRTVLAVHALSRRTELYAGYSRLRNAGTGAYAISDATTAHTGVTPGAAPSLFALGVKHTF